MGDTACSDDQSPGGGAVAVVGSANVDVVFSVERIPAPGETLLASSVTAFPGGKGLNQAAAAARAGAATTFVGALGRDENGRMLDAAMTDAGIVSDLVRRVDGPSGSAFIVVDSRAENTVIVAPGANAGVASLTEGENAAVAASSVLLMQLEVPMSVVVDAAAIARAAGTTVMLNAAPASPLPQVLLDVLDYLIVNEHEACLLGGSENLGRASMALAARVARVVVTVGAEGAVLYEHGVEVGRVSPPRVRAVDTTGAGDAFCGAFAAAVAEGRAFADAADFATVVAALSVQTPGAVPSMPDRPSIEAALRGRARRGPAE